MKAAPQSSPTGANTLTGAGTEARQLIIGRGLRAFVDCYIAVLLPAYLLALGFGTWEVGLLSTATLLDSASLIVHESRINKLD